MDPKGERQPCTFPFRPDPKMGHSGCTPSQDVCSILVSRVGADKLPILREDARICFDSRRKLSLIASDRAIPGKHTHMKGVPKA